MYDRNVFPKSVLSLIERKMWWLSVICSKLSPGLVVFFFTEIGKNASPTLVVCITTSFSNPQFLLSTFQSTLEPQIAPHGQANATSSSSPPSLCVCVCEGMSKKRIVKRWQFNAGCYILPKKKKELEEESVQFLPKKPAVVSMWARGTRNTRKHIHF